MGYYKNGVWVSKTDGVSTNGLAGVSNSLAYRVHEIEKHFHSRERWMGKAASQTATDWALESTLTPFTAISGTGVFGVDTNDEALVLGTDDTPVIAGMVKYDLHYILVATLSADTPYILRLIYGAGTMAAADSAGQYTDIMVHNIVTGSKAGGVPLPVMMPRVTCGVDKVWVRAKCATNNATATFFIGLHEYVG